MTGNWNPKQRLRCLSSHDLPRVSYNLFYPSAAPNPDMERPEGEAGEAVQMGPKRIHQGPGLEGEKQAETWGEQGRVKWPECRQMKEESEQGNECLQECLEAGQTKRCTNNTLGSIRSRAKENKGKHVRRDVCKYARTAKRRRSPFFPSLSQSLALPYMP